MMRLKTDKYIESLGFSPRRWRKHLRFVYNQWLEGKDVKWFVHIDEFGCSLKRQDLSEGQRA